MMIELNLSFSSLYKRILSYKKGIRHIFLLLFLSSAIQLVFPFLTQSIVDIGINNNDFSFIYLILISQFVLLTGSVSVDFIRRWIVFHIGLRINIDLSNLFAQSIINKDVSFFENKKEGDFLQRIIDNIRIESFLTNTTLSAVTAALTLFLFGSVLLFYNTNIFFVFLIATLVLIGWISFFMKKRKKIDNKRFKVSAKSRSELLEIINGISVIKLNTLQQQRMSRWEKIQLELLKTRMQMLELGQVQRGGAIGINQMKNIAITFISATAVIAGNMTLGEMLAVQFIIGQLDSPVRDLVNFIQSYQDSKLSIERLADIVDGENLQTIPLRSSRVKGTIEFQNVSLEKEEQKILDNISLSIPYGKKIGIVGESGSGKTTLLKLLLKLFSPTNGKVLLAGKNFKQCESISDNFGVVFQDSFLFSSSIKYNISLSTNEQQLDKERLRTVIKTCKLDHLIREMPHQLNTRIGKGGRMLSRGQQQRILIARALYKQSNYLLFDEFTNSLDNITKAEIIENIYRNYADKTIISVAHKLEDLAHVDYLYVMKNGKIVEEGKPNELLSLKNNFHKLHKLEYEQQEY